jgi:hypothetical protein
MGERTFRLVISVLLAGALALAVFVVIAVLPPRAGAPSPSSTAAAGGSASAVEMPTPTAPTPTEKPPPAFTVVEVDGVGQIRRGGSSARSLVLQFTESSAAAIPDAPGSFWVTLTDDAGSTSTVSFEGVPVFAGPDSLGATTALVAPNVLQISIEASDVYNVELIRISGLGISTTAAASLGAIHGELSHFSGSLAGGATSSVLPLPGAVIAGP